MESLRTKLVIQGKMAANGFTPDNAGLSPFMQRLARTHANCVESLPIFGGLLLIAIVMDKASLINPQAYLFLVAEFSSPWYTWFH